MTRVQEPSGRIALALGPSAAILIAGVLTGVRGTIGTTNIALVMACLVVAAGLAGRSAGIATAVTAAVSYNFFHTQPYRSLRIDARTDVVTVVLLAVIGVAVSEISARRRHASDTSRRHLHGEQVLQDVAAAVAGGADPDQVWSTIRPALMAALDLTDCRFEPGEQTDLPELPRSGSLLAPLMRWGQSGFELAESGAALTVAHGAHVLGHVILMPAGHRGSTIDSRRMAVALADLFAVTLALANDSAASADATTEHVVHALPVQF